MANSENAVSVGKIEGVDVVDVLCCYCVES